MLDGCSPAFGAAATPAVADQPPGLLRYEGRWNQGGRNDNGTSNRLQGYEGQPGKYGGH